jgi:hypothetical protein
MRKVEVLVFEGCPNVDAALAHVRAAIAETNETADVKVVHVENDETAARLRFLGSPTVRVDDIDVDPSACGRDTYGLQCRIYSVDGRIVGAPPADWIAATLRGEAHGAASTLSADCCGGGASGRGGVVDAS